MTLTNWGKVRSCIVFSTANFSMAISSEIRYEDFYEAPKKKAKGPKQQSQELKEIRGSRVKFNDEVKVKTIKAKGKGKPLSSLDLYADSQMDDEDSGGEYDDLLGEELSDGDDDAEASDPEFLDHGQDDTDGDGRAAVERLKDDLFADDEKLPATGSSSHPRIALF